MTHWQGILQEKLSVKKKISPVELESYWLYISVACALLAPLQWETHLRQQGWTHCAFYIYKRFKKEREFQRWFHFFFFFLVWGILVVLWITQIHTCILASYYTAYPQILSLGLHCKNIFFKKITYFHNILFIGEKISDDWIFAQNNYCNVFISNQLFISRQDIFSFQNRMCTCMKWPNFVTTNEYFFYLLMVTPSDFLKCRKVLIQLNSIWGKLKAEQDFWTRSIFLQFVQFHDPWDFPYHYISHNQIPLHHAQWTKRVT